MEDPDRLYRSGVKENRPLYPKRIDKCTSIFEAEPCGRIMFEKGKNAFFETKQIAGVYFWSLRYCVNTVVVEKAEIKKYIRDHGAFEKHQGKCEFDVSV